MKAMQWAGSLYSDGKYVKMDRVQGMVWYIRAYHQAEILGIPYKSQSWIKKARVRMGFGEFEKVREILVAENTPIPDFLQVSYIRLLLNPY